MQNKIKQKANTKQKLKKHKTKPNKKLTKQKNTNFIYINLIDSVQTYCNITLIHGFQQGPQSSYNAFALHKKKRKEGLSQAHTRTLKQA